MNIFLFISIMLPLAFSPGPANISLANHSSSFGIKRTLSFFAGLMTSSFIIVLITVIFLNKLVQENSIWYMILQALGALYMLYLSYKIMTINPLRAKAKKCFSFFNGVILNVTNSKFYLMISIVAAQFPLISVFDYVVFIFLFLFLNLMGNFLWIVIGGIGYRFNEHNMVFNLQKYFYSLMLGGIAIFLLYKSIRNIFAHITIQ